MSNNTEIKVNNYSIVNTRLFENSRGMVGFYLTLEFNGKAIGDVSHDGDSITYSYVFATEHREHSDIVTDVLIDLLLEANGY